MKKSKIIILLVLLVAIGAGAFLFFHLKNKDEKVPEADLQTQALNLGWDSTSEMIDEAALNSGYELNKTFTMGSTEIHSYKAKDFAGFEGANCQVMFMLKDGKYYETAYNFTSTNGTDAKSLENIYKSFKNSLDKKVKTSLDISQIPNPSTFSTADQMKFWLTDTTLISLSISNGKSVMLSYMDMNSDPDYVQSIRTAISLAK